MSLLASFFIGSLLLLVSCIIDSLCDRKAVSLRNKVEHGRSANQNYPPKCSLGLVVDLKLASVKMHYNTQYGFRKCIQSKTLPKWLHTLPPKWPHFQCEVLIIYLCVLGSWYYNLWFPLNLSLWNENVMCVPCIILLQSLLCGWAEEICKVSVLYIFCRKKKYK